MVAFVSPMKKQGGVYKNNNKNFNEISERTEKYRISKKWIFGRSNTQDVPSTHRQVSFSMYVPLAGVVISMFGSDSQVMLEPSIRTYLYCMSVLAGRLTVTSEQASKRHGDTNDVIFDEMNVLLQMG